jgi:hypothetical protein
MDHRYGRHGPHAWLHWYKRHRARPSILSVSVVHPLEVIRIYVPASNAERTIFIVLTPGKDDENSEIEFGNASELSIENPLGRFIRENLDFIEDMKIVAHDEGLKKAQEDIEKSGTDLSVDRLPVKEQLYKEAVSDGIKYVQANNPSVRGDVEKQRYLSNIYAEAYVDGYQQWIRKDLPDEETSRIWHTADKDKRYFQDRLYPRHVAYLAVIRAQEHLSSTLGSEITSEGLQKIDGYVEIYRQAYDAKERL